MKKCKITVVKENFDEELSKKYISIPNFGKCPAFNVGEVYYTGGVFGSEMPAGFCAEAWDAIGKTAAVFAGGGKYFGMSDSALMCCNDGARPVVFLLEPYEDDEEIVF